MNIRSLLKNKKQNTYFAFCTLCLLGFALFTCLSISEREIYGVGNASKLGVILLLCFAVLGIAMAAGLYAAVRKNVKTENLYLFSGIAAVLIYFVLFPPISVPDEQAHFYSAYYFSNFLCCPLKQLKTQGIVFRKGDFDIFLKLLGNPDVSKVSPQNYSALIKSFKFFDTSSGYAVFAQQAVTNAPLGYIPAAIGIALARLFNLGLYPAFYLGRLFNMAAFIALVYLAIKITPVGKPFFFTAAMLPMTLHLAASVSYDAIVIALVMLFVAYVLKLIKSDKKLTARNYIALFLLGSAVSISKLVYLPVIIMIMFIPAGLITQNKTKAFWLKAALLCACGVVFVLFGIGNVITTLGSENLSYENGGSYTVSWALSNIKTTVRIFLKTFYDGDFHFSDYYFGTMVGSSLAWFQLESPTFLWAGFYALLALALICGEGSSNLTFFNRLWLIAAIIGSGLLVMASMFFAWTPTSSAVILGIQGRYFLPLIIPLFAAVKVGKVSINGNFEKYVCTSSVFLSFVFIINLFGLILK